MPTRGRIGAGDLTKRAKTSLWLLEVTLDEVEHRLNGEFYRSVDCSRIAVLARNEHEARSVASEACEGAWWMDPTLTMCTRVAINGRPRVVVESWPALE